MDELLTTDEVCNLLKISRRTLERWRKMGLPSTKVGSLVRFRKSDIEQWLNKHTDNMNNDVFIKELIDTINKTNGMTRENLKIQLKSFLELIKKGKNVYVIDAKGEYINLKDYSNEE